MSLPSSTAGGAVDIVPVHLTVVTGSGIKLAKGRRAKPSWNFCHVRAMVELNCLSKRTSSDTTMVAFLMRIEAYEDASNASLGLFAVGFVGGRPFSYYDGAAEGAEMGYAWLGSEKQLVRVGWNVNVISTEATNRQSVKYIGTIYQGMEPESVR